MARSLYPESCSTRSRHPFIILGKDRVLFVANFASHQPRLLPAFLRSSELPPALGGLWMARPSSDSDHLRIAHPLSDSIE